MILSNFSIQEKYGQKFTVTDDDLLLNGKEILSESREVIFYPYAMREDSRYRVVSVVMGGQAQLMNAPLTLAGWCILVHRPFKCTGSLNMEIPEGALIPYGYYHMEPCVNQPAKRCKNILNPHQPDKVIEFRYEPENYILGGLPPHNFTYLDLRLVSEQYGEGYGHGYFPKRDWTPETPNLVQGYANFVFPPYPFPYDG